MGTREWFRTKRLYCGQVAAISFVALFFATAISHVFASEIVATTIMFGGFASGVYILLYIELARAININLPSSKPPRWYHRLSYWILPVSLFTGWGIANIFRVILKW